MILFFTWLRSGVGSVFVALYTGIWALIVITAGFLNLQRLATILIRIWGLIILGVFGIRVVAKGEENLPATGGGIIVFNHQSHFDIPVILAATKKDIRFGAKIELFKIPFFGPAMRSVGTLPIAREKRDEVMRIYKQAERRFRQNILFVLAPEGTRQKEPQIGVFKKGPFIFAINAGVPIIPAVIRGAHSVMPKKSLAVNVGQLSRTIEIEFLTPVETVGHSPEEASTFVEKVREAMVTCYRR